MNAEYLQTLRYKLQKRVRRLNSTGFRVFHFSLRQFWGFLQSHPLFVGILQDLAQRRPDADSSAQDIVQNRKPLVFESEVENAAACYFTIKRCVQSDDQMSEVNVGFAYGPAGGHDDHLEHFKSLFLEPLYDYIDEQIDDQRAILAVLRRYKHKCEWFQCKQLHDLWKGDTRRGEWNLSLHMCEYLHDQGLDFFIEPWSVSGEADLVAAQKTDDPLIADAKIFNPEQGRGPSYIAKGFHQIYIYTRNFNEPFGYLIIYNTSDQDLRLTVAKQEQSTPFIVHNSKTIFLLTIDIYPHQVSASKRGDLKTVEITEDDLVKVVREGQENPAG